MSRLRFLGTDDDGERPVRDDHGPTAWDLRRCTREEWEAKRAASLAWWERFVREVQDVRK